MESETEGQAQAAGTIVTASAQMRAAREAAGLQLTEVAARTRVPLRHLEALERGDFAALPGITYCAGFARAYARAVGLDEKALVAKVREEIDEAGDFSPSDAYQMEEPADPARVPPRSLAWVVAIAGVLMVSGYGIWRMQINTPPGEEVVADAPTAARVGTARPRPVQPTVQTGPVVLTAVEDVWLRIYDADGKSILQKTLTKGESFTVPATANHPMILTGRPDALSVTVGGRAIPPLGTAERTISDVPISAEALLARGVAQAPVNAGQTPVNGAPQGAVSPVAVPPTPAPQAAAPVATRSAPAVKPVQTSPRAIPAAEPRKPATSAEPHKPASPAAPRKPAASPVRVEPHGVPATAAPAAAPASNASGE